MKNLYSLFYSFVVFFLLICTPCLIAGENPHSGFSSYFKGFIENKGQVIDQSSKPNPAVLYLLPTPGMNVQLRKGGFSYDAYRITNDISTTLYPTSSIQHPASSIQFHRIDLDLIGYNPEYTVETGPPSTDYINYYTPGTSSEGVRFVRSFRNIIYKDIYPGIDLEFVIDNEGYFEYTFILHPGSDLQAIKLKVEGPDRIRKRNDGIVYKTDIGKIEETIPVCFYRFNDQKVDVKGKFYRISNNLYGFRIDQKIPYDATLTIDPIPTRKWATYYGGDGQEECPWGKGSAAMKDGTNIYCGSTGSADNIATSGAHQSSFGGYCDAFLVKFNLAGQRIWATYYGGTAGDWGISVAYDKLGNIFMGGRTWSMTNIYTTGAFDTTLEGMDDAFLVKFDPDGVRQWGTYYGGTGTLVDEFFTSISIDSNNNIYCAGYTSSPDNIATPGSHQPVFGGLPSDVFLTKWNEAGQRIWGTYYGGSWQDDNAKCCVTKDGTVFLSGCTLSPNNIATPGSFMPNMGTPGKGFLASFNPSGQRQWGTYYGGEAVDDVYGCSADTGLFVYITGATGSASNMATPGAFQTTYIGPQACAFLAKFDISGNRIWSTYYGAGGETCYDVAVDDSGYVFMIGVVNNQDNIVATTDGYQTLFSGINDAFLVKFSGDDKRQWGTYYGGESMDLGLSIVTDTSDHVFIEGYTTSATKIATSNGEQPVYGGNWDCFMVRFNDCYSPDSASIINGPDTVCQYTDGVVYSIANIPLATGYVWTGSTSLVVTAGQNTTSATFSFGYKTGNATISVYGYNECGDGVVKTKTVFVKPRPVPMVTGQDTVCEGATKLYWTTGGKSNYQWTVSGGGIVIAKGTPTDSSAWVQWNSSGLQWVKVNYTDSNGCDGLIPAQIDVLVTPSPAADITVAASDNPVCIGSTVNFTATPTNGGISPSYQWKVNGINAGTDSPAYSYIPVNGDLVTCTLTSSDSCVSNNPAGSNLVIMTVDLILPVTISISGSGNPVCAGTSVTFTATPQNEGSSPVYQWQVNGINTGANNPVLLYTPLNNDVVTCILTSSETACVTNNPDTSNQVMMTVDPILPVSITISPSENPVCEGSPVTFTAMPVNEGFSPVYQWQVNGINVGTNSPVFTYNPGSSDLVSCILTSTETCVTGNPAISNTVVMTVTTNLPVTVSVSASANPVCAGTSVQFTALPINEGLLPVYQWKVNGINTGPNAPLFNYIPANNDEVICVLTSSLGCTTGNPATSNTVVMTVNPNLPVSVSISASANNICAGTTVIFTAAGINEGSNPVYQWKVNGISAGGNSTTFSYVPLSGDQVTCTLTSDVTCAVGNPATSNTIIMVVNPNLPVSVSIAASANPVCEGTSVTFIATPVNGGTLPFYQWMVNGAIVGTNSPIYSYSPASGDLVSCTLTSNATCAIGNPAASNTIIMTVASAPVVTFSACFDTMTTINARPIKLRGGIPLGGSYTGAGISAGIFYPAIAGPGTHIITYTYTNAASCFSSDNLSLHVLSPPPFACGSLLVDIRDSKSYPTVQLGGQCWMAANLNYGLQITGVTDQRDNCVNEKYCYNDAPASCQQQGALYQWDEMMKFDVTAAIQGLCPPAWHLPTEADWNTLFALYISNAFAGSPLKYSGFSGFNALLSGIRAFNKTWNYDGFATFFWSSTAWSSTKAWAHAMNEIDPSVAWYPSYRTNAFSVRCVKD